MGRKSGIALVGPGEALELHVVPADGDTVFDEAREAVVQLLALLARDAQAFGEWARVEFVGGVSVEISAGQRALAAEIAARRVPDLRDGIVGPRNAAVDLVTGLPEAVRLPADFG